MIVGPGRGHHRKWNGRWIRNDIHAHQTHSVLVDDGSGNTAEVVHTDFNERHCLALQRNQRAGSVGTLLSPEGLDESLAFGAYEVLAVRQRWKPVLTRAVGDGCGDLLSNSLRIEYLQGYARTREGAR